MQLHFPRVNPNNAAKKEKKKRKKKNGRTKIIRSIRTSLGSMHPKWEKCWTSCLKIY